MKSRLKISRINNLNDPYEFNINFVGDRGSIEDEYLTKVKDHYDKLMGMVCFNKR